MFLDKASAIRMCITPQKGWQENSKIAPDVFHIHPIYIRYAGMYMRHSIGKNYFLPSLISPESSTLTSLLTLPDGEPTPSIAFTVS